MTDAKMLREGWLMRAVRLLAPEFAKRANVDLPDHVRVSCGWPSKGSQARKHKRVGECWSPKRSADKATEVFVSPVLDDAVEVLAVLVHELVHAGVGTKAGHRAPFARAAKAMGLVPPMTHTEPSADMRQWLGTLAAELGPYPHRALGAGFDVADRPRKQGTRMLRCQCPTCGYTLRTTRKWLDVAVPTCPVDRATMDVEAAEENA